MTQRTAVITANGQTIVGTYHGGAYIDLHFDRADAPAFDVINVYDYAAGKATIPFTSDAVRDEMLGWVEAAGDSLAHDLDNYAEMVGKRRSTR